MKFPGARLLARIVLALVAVAAVVIAVTGCSSSKSETSAKAKVGDCVVSAASADAKVETVDCSSDKALYKVAKTSDKKTECGNRMVGSDDTSNGFLCLAPNFKQSKCYAEIGTSGWKSADCAAPEASFKVVQRIDGQADELACGSNAEKFITIDEPKTTFCLAKPKA
ncbi:hypothetical protein [Nocardia sp. NPDC052566]|uniref:LppU/SCO3897 family protein n=1 Tax=Nocardia sp. NPDC052566 TaxID=3364330 RepID=UPI0037CC5C35